MYVCLYIYVRSCIFVLVLVLVYSYSYSYDTTLRANDNACRVMTTMTYVYYYYSNWIRRLLLLLADAAFGTIDISIITVVFFPIRISSILVVLKRSNKTLVLKSTKLKRRVCVSTLSAAIKSDFPSLQLATSEANNDNDFPSLPEKVNVTLVTFFLLRCIVVAL